MGTNKIIAGMFSQMAEALASQKDNPFKVSAYRKAAKVLAEYPIDVAEAYRGAVPYHSDILIDGMSLCDTSRP
jgi:DNA polymerase/3'-5' exonuclease PolX